MNKYLINVKGKNIANFLIKIDKKKINVLNITFIDNDSINIIIKKEEFDLLNEIKGIYEYKIIKEYGVSSLKEIFLKNIHLLILIIINIALIIFISNHIYEVEIVEDSKELKTFVTNLLEEKNIKKYKKKPSNLNTLKQEILKENNDKLEWIEIIESGIKYIVKVEERIKGKIDSNNSFSDIVASKDGVIKKIVAESGKIVVLKDAFVKKGDILITGIISENNYVRSKGKVIANTWYKVKVEESLHEKSYSLTNNKKKGFKIKFFNKEFLFYKEYKSNEKTEKIIFKNSIIPFYLSLDEVIETTKVDHILTIEEAKSKAILKAREKIASNLKEDEKIISENQLKVSEKDSKIIVEILFTIYEDISKEKGIEVLNVQRDNRSSN